MAIALSQEHRDLAEVVRGFLAHHRARTISRAVTDGDATGVAELWSAMAGQGWMGIHLPEAFGGAGYGLPELAIVLEEHGRALTPGPFLASAVVSSVLAIAGSDAQKSAHLPGLADGSVIGAFAVHTTLVGGAYASLCLVPAGDDALLVDRDTLTCADVRSLDSTQGLVRIESDMPAPTAENTVVGGGLLLRRLARLLAAAEMAGGAGATLDAAVEYAKIRTQFGRTIGSFQAIKHHCADMLVQSELAVATAWDAVRTSPEADDIDLVADTAALVTSQAFLHNAQFNIQIHGGIGFTWEHDAHLYLRRSRSHAALLAPRHTILSHVFARVSEGARREFSFALPPEAEEYRAAARALVADFHSAAPEKRRAVLAESGYLVPHWPIPYGRGAGAIEQLVIEEELDGIEIPGLGIGGWVLLTLVQQATDEQKQRWIHPSLHGELTWCQLFSEPGAGSDAAAVSTKAVRVDGGWRVSGQKVWTSNAQDCNRGLATVRTDSDAPKHQGITAMVIDMAAPGVTVRPLTELTGRAFFNEVYFDDVFVPDADIVGAVDGGWAVARATLGNERVSIGGGTKLGPGAYDLVDWTLAFAPGDAGIGREAAELVVEELAMRVLELRRVARAVSGEGPGPEGSVSKLLSAEHSQRVTELGMEICGSAAVLGGAAPLDHDYLFARSLTIAGGTSEISRNVIAERVLGLPRDPLAR
jgi:alkylation response protein AidB-like acyl-CoA dehydrogenase